MIIFTDFHHNSLLRSLHLLFEDRLGFELYRPFGMEWFYEGFWAINDLEPTARQFLELGFDQIVDKTPPLNEVAEKMSGWVKVWDPGHSSWHRAIDFDTFKSIKIDFIIASIPQHIPLFERLIREYQPQAKLIVQIGNNWDPSLYEGHNVLASVLPYSHSSNTNMIFYHQEFEASVFNYQQPSSSRSIHSFINVLESHRVGYNDFVILEGILKDRFVKMKSFGGQCRDGNFAGPVDLAKSIHSSDMVFHSKDGGDGYGHVLHNAAACGRPIITRESFYRNCLGRNLLKPGSYINLDDRSLSDSGDEILRVMIDTEKLNTMSLNIYNAFVESVNFEEDSKRIKIWLESL